MKILVVGGGGREHALIMKLAESSKTEKIFCVPGNGGISRYAECFPNVSATDIDAVVDLAKQVQADLVVVAPDDPLVLGMVDALNQQGFKTFGPNKAGAIIEGSKVFSKQLMKKYNIPTAKYEVFSNSKDAIEYIKKEDTYPTVIKADGLALGKGVIMAEDYAQAEDGIKSIMEDRVFGESGANVVIEEFLTGPEVSVLCFTDGKTIKPMVSSMDHKRALDGDKGLNTGGMGTVSPNPFMPNFDDEMLDSILKPFIKGLKEDKIDYRGVIFIGLMIDNNKAKVLEFNVRFGDPETQSIMLRLESDLFDIMYATSTKNLKDISVKWNDDTVCTLVLASQGYPNSYPKGLEIKNLDKLDDDIVVFHAGTKIVDNKLVTNGGRVLNICAKGNNLEEARAKAYKAAEIIDFEGKYYRKDIGLN